MEGRGKDNFQWLFRPDSDSPNHQLSSQNHSYQISTGSHVSPNNPSFQNQDPYQSPNFLQRYNYSITQTLPRASEQGHECSLESSFSRLNMNVPSNNHQPHQLIDANNLQYHLQMMRIESAVRGQMGLFHDSLGGHSNSTSSLRTQNFIGGATSSIRSTRIFGNPSINSNALRRVPSLDELANSRPCRPTNNTDHLQCWGNSWAVNGDFELENNPSSLPSSSSMYNHRPVVYDRQQQQHRFKCSSLEELKGQVSSVAKDQYGCRFLQKQFDNKNIKSEEIEMILSGEKDGLHDLMVGQSANYVILKLFESGNQEQRTQRLLDLVSSEQKFLTVCTDVNGSRAVQKIMEGMCTAEERSTLLSVLKPITITLTNNIHGHHIIEHCLNNFSNDDTKDIVDEIVEHCFDIATDKSGCCVLQQCLALAKPEARDRLLTDITANAFILSEDPYGNYVVQYVIGMKMPHVTENLVVQLGGSYVTLSMNKYGSNVVEKCLKDAGEEHAARIITEIMHDPDFLKVPKDSFGNYVVQSALNVSKGDLYNALFELIQHHHAALQSHPFGKNVLARIKGRKNRV